MIRGHVNSHRRAVVPVQVVDSSGLLVDLEAAVDTGFSGFLTLPSSLIQVLQLPFDHSDLFTLGDERDVEFDLYMASLNWNGQTRPVSVLAADGMPLVGMSLLEGYHLSIDIVIGGEVLIQPRP